MNRFNELMSNTSQTEFLLFTVSYCRVGFTDFSESRVRTVAVGLVGGGTSSVCFPVLLIHNLRGLHLQIQYFLTDNISRTKRIDNQENKPCSEC